MGGGKNPWQVSIDHEGSQEFTGPIANKAEDCGGFNSRPFCLGKFTPSSGAVGGFLGKWAAGVERENLSRNWHRVSSADHPVVKEILGATSDQYEWKQLLMCIVSRALRLNHLEADTATGKVEIWRRRNWQVALNKGINSPWNSQAAGQGTLIALTCLIRALLGQHPQGPELSQDTQNLCEGIWSLVKINPRSKRPGEGREKVKSLGRFLDVLREGGDKGGIPYGSLGLLLSIYYGMNKCCKRQAPFDLTGLVDNGNLDLGEMGACTIDRNLLSCSGNSSRPEDTRLIIWKPGSRVLFRRAPPDVDSPPNPRLTTQDSEEDVARLRAETAKRNEEYV
ncbi:hypothetical protein C922_05582 [Plasmodium inui San Antonio 1]|uniref:Uncharacterized protein n=1 Tax=Plasmodium inui San Antonio 1 TaxID=1237626 RepID=W6ZXM9_9APIC|nr:hypothetical protein C922_05582 [Plasmodium inui San Antonio 1]EUD64038.1 hypothetical protein C922_05582 [Plasmodium inui San Antonio 1]